jgi:hypothetical protein
MSEFQENIAQADDPRLKLVDRAMKRLQYQPDALIEVLLLKAGIVPVSERSPSHSCICWNSHRKYA